MIIALANQKGGVGKTTTCVSLAAAVAEKKKKTLLLDLDPQGNASSGLGIDKNALEYSSYELLVEEIDPAKIVQSSGRPYLDVLPANMNLAGAELQLKDREKREFVLRDAMEAIASQYDYVFIDCPPSLGLLTLNALTAANEVLIPVQAEYYALEGLSQIHETINAVQSQWNPKLRINGALLTMYDSRTQLAKQVAEEIRQYYKGLAYDTMIPRNVRLSEAPSHGKTILEYERWSKGARAYRALAKEFLKRQATS